MPVVAKEGEKGKKTLNTKNESPHRVKTTLIRRKCRISLRQEGKVGNDYSMSTKVDIPEAA